MTLFISIVFFWACVCWWSHRWRSAGVSARTNQRWTTRSWAVACVTTTTKTSSIRRRASATSTASSVTCRACWESRHRRSWAVWTFYPQTQSPGSALGYRQPLITAVKRGFHSRADPWSLSAAGWQTWTFWVLQPSKWTLLPQASRKRTNLL